MNISWLSSNCCQVNKETAPTPNPLISDDLCQFILTFALALTCQVISMLGAIANIINMIVFYKQGFSDSMNVSLMALTVSDLLSLITMIWTNFCFAPAVRDSSIPVVTTQIHLITGTWMHIAFLRVTGWITAFISFERCICVILPLKVKSMLTHNTHLCAVAIIYSVTLGFHSMIYFTVGIDWVFYPERNQTLLGLVYILQGEKRRIIDSISYALNGSLMPISCFLIVSFCTIFLVSRLNEKAAWRTSNSSAKNQPVTDESKSGAVVPTREQKVTKMIVLVSAVFITSFLPAVLVFIAKAFEPQLTYYGLYKNVAMVTFSAFVNMEAFNSSINICIYLTMSTKYRETFINLFGYKRFKKT